jgi:hypothetical protein
VWLAEYHQILPLILRDTHDLEAELEQLVMDARRSPQWIFGAHPLDERAQVC